MSSRFCLCVSVSLPLTPEQRVVLVILLRVGPHRKQCLHQFFCCQPTFPVCLYVYPSYCCQAKCTNILPFVTRQQLGRNVTAATNIHATMELLDSSFSIWSVSYQSKLCNQFFAELLVLIQTVNRHLNMDATLRYLKRYKTRDSWLRTAPILYSSQSLRSFFFVY